MTAPDESCEGTRALLQDAAEIAASFLESPGSLQGEDPPEALLRLFGDPTMPEQERSVAEALRHAVAPVLRNSVRMDAPTFIGHMASRVPVVAHVADLLISVMNQNLVKLETARSGTYVERQALAWLHRLVYCRDDGYYRKRMHDPAVALGNFVGGGTIGNLTALAVARNAALPGAAKDGLPRALAARGASRAVIVAGARAHYSIRKVASLLGLGERGLEIVPVERFTNRVSRAALASRLRELERERALPIAIVGVAGSTETGSVDDLVALADIAAARETWLHVDAAWGGTLLASPRQAGALDGIARADSVVIDGHKLLGTTMGNGAVLFRDETALARIAHSAEYIVREGSADLGRTSVEGSRPFSSFKTWLALTMLGRPGLSRIVDRSVYNATVFEQLIATSRLFELTSARETNIVSYRYVPAPWRRDLAACRARLQDAARATSPQGLAEHPAAHALRRVTSALNAINVELQERQRSAGRSFISRTRLESVELIACDVVVLRAIPFNPRTTRADLIRILSEQAALGESLVRETRASCA
jgi:glutamate decarboxylase